MIEAWITWPPTEDQVVSILALVAATIAAVFAVRADSFGRRDAKRSAAERDADVQPRVTASWAGTNVLRLANTGGAATHFVWVGQDGDRVVAATGSVSPHSGPLAGTVTPLGACPYPAGRGTTLLVARDVHDRWWDCRTSHKLKAPVEDYLAKRMQQVGLPHLCEPLIAAYLPRPLPPEATHL